VIAVQVNDRVESVLLPINTIGGMIGPIVGSAKIAEALKRIRPGNSQNRMIDR
jgi:hypothetical protein